MLQLTASDPDGPDEGLTYVLTAGARDNFIINSTSGEITVAQGSNLDRDRTPKFQVSDQYRNVSTSEFVLFYQCLSSLL